MTQHAARISVSALAGYLTSVLGEPVAVQSVRALGATEAALVLAHPRWYPSLAGGDTRAELLHFARCMAEATRFDPADLSWICGVAR